MRPTYCNIPDIYGILVAMSKTWPRALAVVAAVALVPLVPSLAASAGAQTSRQATAPLGSARDLTGAAERVLGAFAHDRAATTRTADSFRASSVTGSLSVTDPTGDATDARADLTAMNAAATTSEVRLGVTVAKGTNPYQDSVWTAGDATVAWGIDTTGDGTVDYLAILFAPGDGTLAGGVVNTNDDVACFGNATWDGAGTYAIQFPSSCVHLGAQAAVGSFMTYGAAQTAATDYAPDGSVLAQPLVPASTATPTRGALMVDGWGGLHFTGIDAANATPRILGAPYWPGWDIARDVATTPDGGHGFVLDGFGGLHGFGLNGNSLLAAPAGAPYWNGWDIARGVALAANGGGGYVLDAWGGLHPFSLGPAVAKPIGGPYWPGWEVARAVATMPDGSGGFVLDGWGGLHWFSLGTTHAAPRIFGAAYWPGWDIARGITILPDGSGGYVADAWGGMHWFSLGAPRKAPALSGAPYWPGWDIARGVTAIPGLLALPSTSDAQTARLVPLTGTLQNVVIDDAGKYAYVTNSSLNEVEVVALATGTKVASIPVGSQPFGLDLTPDGQTLYVANSGANSISVIDVATHTETRRITVPSQQYINDRPYSLVIMSNGTALFTTTEDGSGFGARVMQLDLANDTLTRRMDVSAHGSVTQQTVLARSADRSTATLLLGDISDGPLQRYDADTDSFVASRNLGTYITTVAVAGNGSRALIDGNYDLDASLATHGTITGTELGEALDATGATGYRTATTTDSVEVLDMTRDLVTRTISMPDTIPHTGAVSVPTSGVGHMALTPAGSTLVVITDHGLSILPTA